MGSKRASEHDNIMSLLIIASSQADSEVVVISSNSGSGKETKTFMNCPHVKIDRIRGQWLLNRDTQTFCSTSTVLCFTY